MIKIEKIEIQEFRGIRDLTLNFKGNNFAVCGPNGTGKSGIVDAIEFGLTGNISRLSGAGRGEVSVKAHAPHVDSRNHPDKARVIITATITTSNQQVVINRTVKQAENPVITPNDPTTLQILQQVANHPEFALSRRELILYILATPGERSKEIQALLKLDKIEQLRALFVKIANSSKKEIPTLKNASELAADSLLQALEITTLNPEEVLKAANSRRAILNLPPLPSLKATTSLKDGLETINSDQQVIRIPKDQTFLDIKTLESNLDQLVNKESIKNYQILIKDLTAFSLEPLIKQGISRENFLKNAITLLDEGMCPVCGTPWDLEDLRRVIEEKLKVYDSIAKQQMQLEEKFAPIISNLESILAVIELMKANKLLPEQSSEVEELIKYSYQCNLNVEALKSLFPIENSINVLNGIQRIPPQVIQAVAKFSEVISSIPEPTTQDSARDFLIIAQERLEVYRSALRRLRRGEEKARLTEQVSATYTAVSNNTLDSIYKQVEQRFSDFYRVINYDDEPQFSAQLLPSAGKLGFGVDFYGKGFFPPGAYHSEGHQDGMGLCLYLALMKHISGSGFTLAVLDDVLMSVDAGHRREVCALLSKYFPETQFILTTHDEVWLRHMKTEGLIGQGASMRFRTWNVDTGPTEWDQRNVWQEIEDYLKKDDVRSAAGLLRYFLEYTFGEVCHRLRAPVEFRGDFQYQLGDLMPCGVSSLKKLYKAGLAAANSWGITQQVQEINKKINKLESNLTTAEYDKWQINGSIHFNEWADLKKQDFAKVIEAFKTLVENFYCEHCKSFFDVIPARGEKQVIKCTGGHTNINLEKNKSG